MHFFLIVILVLLTSCSDLGKQSHGTKKYYYRGRFLIKESRANNGNIRSVQYLDQDTIPDGALIEYYDNGKVAKWKWFNKLRHPPDSLASYNHASDKAIVRNQWNKEDETIHPDCIAYYDTMGILDTFVGNPFLRTQYDEEGHMWIGVVKPPNTNIKIMQVDFVDKKRVNAHFYNAIYCSDTGCWVGLIHHKPQKGHEYTLYYFFDDSLNHPLFSVGTYMHNDSEKVN